MRFQLIESPLGILAATWSELGLARLSFGRRDEMASDSGELLTEKQDASQQLLARAFEEYFAGGELEFPLASIDWTGVPAFHRRVLEECAKIPRGQTYTYGALAAAAGSPAAARAVGQAMAKNRWPLIIPCHRVIGHSGKLTGYSGVGGTVTKRRLIDFEIGLFSDLCQTV